MRKSFILVFAVTIIMGMQMKAQDNSTVPEKGHVTSVTAVSNVFGDGRKVSTVILEYDEPISNKSLSLKSYSVEGKEVTRVYANTIPEKTEKGKNGKYVIIEVKAELDLYAQPKAPTPESEAKKRERDRMQGGPGLRAGWSTGGDDTYPGNATVMQVADIKTIKGKIYPATNDAFESNVEKCLVADDFKQYEFVSPYTGQILPYNLFLPEDYNLDQKYPLVLFIHDAGVASAEVKQPLYQGTGAVSWATPEAQARHKCIVVAPEYPFITVDDNWNYSHHLDATIALLKDLQTRYSVDSSRIYTTGQSMGCMSSIVMMLKEPDLFAGALLVAGKWLPEVMTPLDKQNIWIISCEGDASSNTLQGQAVNLWRENGAVVTEGIWNMESTPEQFTQEANKMRSEGGHLFFTHLTGGNHRATWFVAYGIEGVQDWLFEQHK